MNNPKIKLKHQFHLCLGIQNKISRNKFNQGGPRWQWHRRMLSSTLPWANWNIHRGITPVRQPKYEWTASQRQMRKRDKQRRLRNCRSSLDWKCQWAPLFLSPSTSIGQERTLLRCFGLCAKSLCRAFPAIPPHGCQAASNEGSKMDQHGVTTCTWPPWGPTSQLPKSHKPLPAPTSLPKVPCTGHLYTRSLSVNQIRERQ